MSIHFYYDKLTDTERDFVDMILNKHTFTNGKELLGYALLGGDSAERAIEGLAHWVIESRNANHLDISASF